MKKQTSHWPDKHANTYSQKLLKSDCQLRVQRFICLNPTLFRKMLKKF